MGYDRAITLLVKDLKKSMMKQKLHTPFIKQVIVYINSITKMTPTSERPKMKLKKLFHFTVTSSHTMWMVPIVGDTVFVTVNFA